MKVHWMRFVIQQKVPGNAELQTLNWTWMCFGLVSFIRRCSWWDCGLSNQQPLAGLRSQVRPLPPWRAGTLLFVVHLCGGSEKVGHLFLSSSSCHVGKAKSPHQNEETLFVLLSPAWIDALTLREAEVDWRASSACDWLNNGKFRDFLGGSIHNELFALHAQIAPQLF